MLSPGDAVHVTKLRADGSPAFAWDGVVLECDKNGIVLRAEFNVDLVDLGFTTFRRGDEFIEFYSWEPEPPAPVRYYNVFQISSPDRTLKGWYCNVGMPAQLDPESGALSYVDLALDVWVHPDGSFVVLDEDELQELLERHPEFDAAARQGRADLLALAHSRRLPRWTQ